MNKKTLIVKNISREGHGLLGVILKERNIAFEIIDLSKGREFPNPSDYTALIVLGGPDRANDKTPKMQIELKKIKKGETVKIDGNTTLLAIGKYCRNQIIKIGKNAYGIQGHLELTKDLLNQWSVEDDDLKNVDTNSLFDDYNKIKKELHENCRKLFANFLEVANVVGT